MNLKIKDNELCFKISEEELKALCAGEVLDARVSLGAQILSVEVCPACEAPHMASEFEQHSIRLHVPQGVLDELSSLGRNRNGVREEKEGTTLILQVDFRVDTRKAQRS